MVVGIVAFDGVGAVLGGFAVEGDAVACDFVCCEEFVFVALVVEADDFGVVIELDACFLFDGWGEDAVEGEQGHHEDDDEYQARLLVC